jgi:RNA polymerase sigma-70 factor (ECF subfamily)
MTTDPSASFEPHRRRLLGLAYRMLGSMAEAEDAVQEAYLRWHDADRENVAEPRAFLITTTTRICLDVLKSARVRREEYVGPWLPDPVTDTAALAPDAQTEMAEDLSVALLLALDRLSPLERAAFLLHDVFDYSFTQVADTLGRNEAACRQLASRARTRVRDARPASAHTLWRGRFALTRAGSSLGGREARGARVRIHHRVAIRRRAT